MVAGGKQALLLMDVVPLVTPAFGGDDALLDRLATAAKAARAAEIPVIFGKVAFRGGYPDVAASNQMFTALPAMGIDFQESNPDTDYHPAVAPQEGDYAFTKRRVSSFVGSDLDVLLRGLDVDHLVLTGVATSGVVLSTLRAAADLDYRLTVLSDGCADGDPEVQNVLVTKVFPMQATVTTVADWMASL
jgi:nicotinamidase-related amidase